MLFEPRVSACKREAGEPTVSSCWGAVGSTAPGSSGRWAGPGGGGRGPLRLLRLRSQLADAAARLPAGSHDNSASCHPGAESVRHFPARLFPGPSPSPGSRLSASKVKVRGFSARPSASRAFLRHPPASACPRPSAQPQPASLWARLRARHFPADCFRVAAGPGALVAVPCSRPERREPTRARLRRRPRLLLASFGRASSAAVTGSVRVAAAETASGASPGRGGVRLRGARRPGSGVPSRAAGATAGPSFSAPREPGLSSGSLLPQGLLRRHLGPAIGGSGQLRRNTPSLATNQGGGHPSSGVRHLRHSGPRPSFWRLTWVCTHCVTLDKSLNLLSLSCLIN